MAADVLISGKDGKLFVEWAVKLARARSCRRPTKNVILPDYSHRLRSGHCGYGHASQIKVGPALKVIQNDIKYYMGKSLFKSLPSYFNKNYLGDHEASDILEDEVINRNIVGK